MREELDDPQTYRIIGAAMAVHRALGCGEVLVELKALHAIGPAK